jgi:pseudaminic acid biosynthesis-associated methylase
MSEPEAGAEATRLEDLWAGAFGDAYIDRNLEGNDGRKAFWDQLLGSIDIRTILEVGCSIGGNLQWIAPHLAPGATHGIDVNREALRLLHERLLDVNAIFAPARSLPFRDRWFDLVFTMGVLIHQPDATLLRVMDEMVRCSRRYVLCGEYFANGNVEVPYRGEAGALFKRDYGRLFKEQFPDLRQVRSGFLGRDQGWDDVTWWLFERD